MKTNTTTYKKTKGFREQLKSVGYFDGRFTPKVVVDKKKEANKNKCRLSVDF